MAGKNQRCPGCGHKIRRPDGFLTNYRGQSWHIGCLETHIKGKVKAETRS